MHVTQQAIMAADPRWSIASLGHLSQRFQKSPSAILTAAATLGIRPAATINGIVHYGEADAARLREHLRHREDIA